MKRWLAVFALLVPLAWTQTKPLPGAGITQQIAMAEERMRAALVEGDAAHLADGTADLFAATLPDGRVLDKTQVVAAHKSGTLQCQSIQLADMKVRVVTPVVGVVTARAIVDGKYGEKDISGEYQYTRVWVRLSARWQQVAWQAVKIK